MIDYSDLAEFDFYRKDLSDDVMEEFYQQPEDESDDDNEIDNGD